MTFRTELPLPSFPFRITHLDAFLSIGSCFTEHIGTRLSTLKFKHLLNPFGIIYNPISIAEQLEWLLSNKKFATSDLFQHQELWHSWMHHGSFSGLDQMEALQKMNQSLHQAQALLPSVTRLLLTLGTANVFVLKESGKIVANCHKMPSQIFTKRRLSVEEIVESFIPISQKLKLQYQELQIIFTVSPVRHIRDGLVENQRSKATLLLAMEEICNKFDFAHYFPAYESVIDDLRDYRFFEADMIHPNSVAIDYVWQRFGEAFFDKNTQELISQIEAITNASRHRAFHSQSTQHQAFVRKQLEKMQALEVNYPFLNFESEKAVLNKS